MQFAHHEESGKALLSIEGDLFRHLFRSRRHHEGEMLDFRNLLEPTLYTYKILTITKNSATLALETATPDGPKTAKNLVIGWCMIEPKEIEDTLAPLNELGVAEIYFLSCRYSQANLRLNHERMKRILINSSMQCGRTDIVKLHEGVSLKGFLERFPDAAMIDFEGKLGSLENIGAFVVGPEGGFCEEERAAVANKIALRTPQILRSTTATLAVASKILV